MSAIASRMRIAVVGAAGRDYHNFNMAYRHDPTVEVVAFTGAQIPGIADRRYPAELAGPLYPKGIPIVDERRLAALCRDERLDRIVFAYSDVSHGFVMEIASIALAAGADFAMLGPNRTMLQSSRYTIAVCAARTGVGKSQTTRWIAGRLRGQGLKAAIIRHPMPYGDLARQAVQAFTSLADLDAAQCTIEEREEYEPHIEAGHAVYAGVDFERVLRLAEADADVVLWDGGNNDFPFIRPDLMIALLDPLRAGDSSTHHPGETVVRMADIAVIAKANAASPEQLSVARAEAARLAPAAPVVEVASAVVLERPEEARGKRVLVVEDGPTTTHGGMRSGAGLAAAQAAGVAEVVDPRPFAVGQIAQAFRDYPHLGPVLPALGYSPAQRADLSATLEACPADVVIVGTPIDLGHIAATSKPMLRARYSLDDCRSPPLGPLLDERLIAAGVLKR